MRILPHSLRLLYQLYPESGLVRLAKGSGFNPRLRV